MNFDDNYLKVTEYKVLDKLPDPFIMNDGSLCNSAEKWHKRRTEIYKMAVELQYGEIPPAPDYTDVKLTYGGSWGRSNSYRITVGANGKQFSFAMKVFLPREQGRYPVVIDGDMCFDYCFDKEFISTFTDNNIVLVMFDRTQIAYDVRNRGRQQGPVFELFPDCDCGAIAAWAWGYSRCVDVLSRLGVADMNCITFTGHSRGGKAAMLAGAIDERAAIVHPNETCAAGCGCYRINMKAITQDGEEKRNETLDDIYNHFQFWFNDSLGEYCNREAELPFDSHYLKALVAPRTLLISEAASDIWSNPIGSWQTTMAAGEVYKFLGAPDNLFWYYRTGYHYHDIRDINMLVNLIRHKYYGDELSKNFFKTPFKKPELIFDWRAPIE